MENKNKIENIKQKIEDIQSQLLLLKQELDSASDGELTQNAHQIKALEVGSVESDQKETIVEGVFDGQNMLGPDGKTYTVPANYASKSKLVEGDIMKLKITEDGTFIYKQIGPVRRIRLKAKLVYDSEVAMYRGVTKKGRSYRLLTASVTYYHGNPGDIAIMLIAADLACKWAAVENIIPGNEEDLTDEEDEELLLTDGSSGELPLGDE